MQLLVIGVMVGAWNVLLSLPLTTGGRWLQRATLVAIGGTAACFSWLNLSSEGFTLPPTDDLVVRVLSAAGILTACGVMGTTLMAVFNRRPLMTRAKTLRALTGLDCTCPRCATGFRAATGTSRCPGCGLLVVVQFAEPRCWRCEYALLDLRGNTCPECGAEV
jgi:Zn finger protein HypA/HybF involved in hydrogenase expression